ncbi:MAG: hypothetical protein CVU44_09700 [Chloroflexi bacterium HGW-Chloroflexi-6]|nr:MAG: hypothetical protein CVU44_09700 [Chloroflexi bacterium HGW-Chloroflexi-6]
MANTKPALPWLMLISRSVLFISAQALIAIFLYLNGTNEAWAESARWWIFFPILANLASIALLVLVFRIEGKRFFDILRFSGETVKTDLIWFFGSSLIGLPLAAAPMNFLGTAIFGDPMIPINMLFRSIPSWALILGILFPLTIGLAELPTYFGYVMPRLFSEKASPAPGWLGFLVAALFLGLQHCFLPFIADGNYLLWRGLMYLPFALYAGLMIKLRPSLLPYFAVVHTLMDFSALSVYLMI